MIDLHCHTSYSDGSDSVKELLEKANKTGISILSITDHNTIQAYSELKNIELNHLFQGKIITGIEITTTYKGEIIEILGYNFELENMQKFLKQNVLTFEEKQIKEYELIKNKFQKIGLLFQEAQIKFDPKTESSRFSFYKEIQKYPENYKFFLNKNSIESAKGFTRNEIYNPKSPLYIDESSLFPSLKQTIDIIHQSGGIAFLAHTFAYSPNIANELINILDNYELDGLECFYTTFTDTQTSYLTNLCNQRNLLMSGGSDFHGTRKRNHNLGIGGGNLKIEESIITNWQTNKNLKNKVYQKSSHHQS